MTVNLLIGAHGYWSLGEPQTRGTMKGFLKWRYLKTKNDKEEYVVYFVAGHTMDLKYGMRG